MVVYASELPGDFVAREIMLDEVFGPARLRKSSERIRSGRRPADGLALAAHDGDRLVGTVRLWHAEANDSGTPVLLLGPLAVAPDRQGTGIGAALMRLAIARARELGHGAVLLVGDEPYYRRFGFSTDGMADLAMPGPFERARFLGLELAAGHLAGARGVLRPTGALVAAPRVEAAA